MPKVVNVQRYKCKILKQSNKNFSFHRELRLTESKQYRKVFREAKKVKQQYLLLQVMYNNLPYSRIGIAIAKNRIPRAVDRNQIKRIIRESFRLAKISRGLDIVVIVQQGFDKLTKAKQREQLDYLWQRLKNN